MKRKNIIYSAIVSLFLFGSCIDLDEKVYDQLTADKYFENFTEADIPGAIAQVYSDLQKLYSGDNAHTQGAYLYTTEESADLWVTPKRGGSWYDGGIYYRLNQHKWLYDDAHFEGNWDRAYKSINNCNRLLYQFESMGFDNEALVSELRVARAFWYYILIDLFGNVPIETKYDNPAGYLPETSKRADVFKFIVKEITESIDHLSDKTYGRWDKFSTSMLLAKVYLNAEVWEGEGKTYWDEVIALCDVIIKDPRYDLEADYKAPFVTDNENSKEIVMGISNDDVYDYGCTFLIHLWTQHWKYQFHANTITGFWGGCCAPPEFANSYDPDDLRFEKSWLIGQLYDNVGNFGPVGAPMYCDPWHPSDKDKLLAYTKDVPLYPNEDTPTTGEQYGARMNKYEIKKGAVNTLSNDFVLFRYADVLFMKAEALYRKGGKVATREIVDLINDVRKRSFVNYTGNKVLKVADLNDERFLQEYAWEFCQEGHRRQQLIRFGVFTSKKWFLHDSSEDFRNLFPIPRKERLANPKLEQNPGYPLD